MATSIEELEKIKTDYVDETLKWYTKRSLWPRLAFRISGTLAIFFSLIIPFLTTLPDNYSPKIIVSLSAFLVALSTSLNSFYGWQKLWEKWITIQLTLEGLDALWKTEMAAAKQEINEGKKFERAFEVTQKLIKDTKDMSLGETKTFFKSIGFPDSTLAEKRLRELTNKTGNRAIEGTK